MHAPTSIQIYTIHDIISNLKKSLGIIDNILEQISCNQANVEQNFHEFNFMSNLVQRKKELQKDYIFYIYIYIYI